MKKLKSKNGITLIALIITIIILLILAIVTINILINQGIIGHAQTAVQKYDEQQVKEDILLTYDEYKMQKFGPNAKSLYDFFNERYDDVEDNGDGSITVTVESNGNTYAYTLKEDGTLENTKGLLLDKTSVVLNLENNKKLTDTLKVTLRGIEGEVTWAVADNTIATISSTTGEEITITAKKQGETKITVTCGDYTKECTVSVLNGLPIGEYINYKCYSTVADANKSKLYYKSLSANNGYADQEFEVTEDIKWKILGRDDNGKVLIISSDPIQTKTNSNFSMQGKVAYVKGPDELNEISKIYSHGTHATGARSVMAEDVYKITNKYPSNTTEMHTYRLGADGYVYTDDTASTRTTFIYYENGEWKIFSNTDDTAQIGGTFFTLSIENSTEGKRMIRYRDDNITDANFWLANRAISCYSPSTGYVTYSVQYVTSGLIKFLDQLFLSFDRSGNGNHAVRPVVTLDITEVNNKVDGVWQIE